MKHYVFSDIHGNIYLYEMIKKYLDSLQEEYQLIFLGDACDRGSYGFSIMCDMLENSNVTYLKGNHEDMFVRAARECYSKAQKDNLTVQEYLNKYASVYYFPGMDTMLYIQNGGALTLECWIKAGADMEIVEKIDNLDISCSYDKYDMCHAGCSIKNWGNEDIMLWDRSHFSEPWHSNRVLIHGHTPICYLNNSINSSENTAPIVYKNGQKIDLDVGTHFTNTIYLLCLETEEFIRF